MGAGNTPSVSPSQGQPGGYGAGGSGGGGATQKGYNTASSGCAPGAVPQDAPGPGFLGNGGCGVDISSSYPGSPITAVAGGGGGGSTPRSNPKSSSGGIGGGGNGTLNPSYPCSGCQSGGTANTGGGGGGGGGGSGPEGGGGASGGSGVVIVKEPEIPVQAPGRWSMNEVYDNVENGIWTN
jgi:hypothetical protein